MAGKFSLGKAERLKSKKLLDEIFKSGTRINQPPLRFIYATLRAADMPLQFGVGVSSKNFRKAVERNRVKRLIREAYRLQKLPLQSNLVAAGKQVILFIIYTGRDLPVYQEVVNAMKDGLYKLSKNLKLPG